MAAGPVSERNQDATIYVGGLDEKVNESLLWELFVQAGPVVNVHMPKDRVTMMHQGYVSDGRFRNRINLIASMGQGFLNVALNV
jgi:RNA recognition motif-containing protein